MKYRVNVTGIMNASAAHIHMAKEGENGDVIADLLNTPTSKGKDTAYGMMHRGNLSDSSLKGPMQGKTLDDLPDLAVVSNFLIIIGIIDTINRDQ